MMRPMSKRTTVMSIVLLLCAIAFPIFPASAAGDIPRLADMADLLSDSEETALLDMLDEISERQKVDIVIVTTDSLEGASAMRYADDLYDRHGFGIGEERNGILLLISMDERECYISTAGYGITAVTDAGREYMLDMFVSSLSEGDYMAGFTTFAELCDDFITQAETSRPYDADLLPQGSFPFVGSFLLAFGSALIISLIATGIMKSQLKTVSRQADADDQIKNDGIQLTKKNDLFLYKHIERTKKPENDHTDRSDTHTSSSGTEHGGGGRKF